MAPTSEIGWGILGPGWIAELFAEDLARTPGARAVAVASRDAAKAKAFADKHGINRSYGDYAALISDPKVDIVYIATPHSHHYQHARMMLEGGKHVMVEKPFTMNAAQGADLMDLARQRGLFLMDAMWTLCNPLYRRLANLVVAGDIGTPRTFSGVIGPMGFPAGDHRILDPKLGGSYTLECLVYPMNILAGLAPNLLKDAEVWSSAKLTERGVDSSASIALRNAEGYATMSGGFIIGAQQSGISGFELTGDSGWIAVTDNLFNPGRAVVSAKGKPVEEIIEPASAERYRWEIEEAGRCIREARRESSIVTHQLTLDVMKVLDRALIQTRGGTLT
jgi:predicted dehydrogenase